MRLASGGVQHETNTFSTTPTTLADFIRYSQLGSQLAVSNKVCQGRRRGGESVGFVLNTSTGKAHDYLLSNLFSWQCCPT